MKTPTLMFAVPFALFLGACAADDIEQGSVLRADGFVPVYVVPVDDPALEPYATYPMNNLMFARDDQGRAVLEYDLPVGLVGHDDESVRFRGRPSSQGPWEMKGNRGDMTCDVAATDLLDCSVVYKNIEIDPAGVESFLTSLDLPAEALAARRDVAMRFMNDPLGVVTGLDLGVINAPY